MKNHKVDNKNIRDVTSVKIKVKPLFCDKDLSSVNLLSKTHDFIKMINVHSKTYDFQKQF